MTAQPVNPTAEPAPETFYRTAGGQRHEQEGREAKP